MIFVADECDTGVCDQLCENTYGEGYICSCEPGYVLSVEDQKTCIGEYGVVDIANNTTTLPIPPLNTTITTTTSSTPVHY